MKGGEFKKWAGLEYSSVDWEYNGTRVKLALDEKYPYLNGNVGFKVKNEELFGCRALTFTTMARGSMGCRYSDNAVFENSGSFIMPRVSSDIHWLACLMNSRLASFLLRAITQSRTFKYKYVEQFVLPASLSESLARLGEAILSLATKPVRANPLELF